MSEIEELEKAVEEARVTMLAARVTYAETWQDADDAREAYENATKTVVGLEAIINELRKQQEK